MGIFKSFGSLSFMLSIISFNSILLKRSILFKVTIIFFPSLINELISLNSFLFKSPETINKIISDDLYSNKLYLVI